VLEIAPTGSPANEPLHLTAAAQRSFEVHCLTAAAAGERYRSSALVEVEFASSGPGNAGISYVGKP
jgi:hypothetical protein